MKKIFLILPILSGILFGSCGIYVRVLSQGGMDPTTQLFSRAIISIFLMLAVILAIDKNLLKIRKSELKIIIIAAVNIIALNLCYIVSTNTIPLSLAAVLLNLAPIFVIIFARIAFKERITLKRIIPMILIIAGCCLTTGLLEGDVFNISAIGILAGIGSAFFWANYNVASKKSVKEGIRTHTLLFYIIITMTVILIPFTNFNQITTFINLDIPMNTLFLIANALLSFILPYALLVESLKYVDVSSAAIFTAGAEPISALVFGVILYNEIQHH